MTSNQGGGTHPGDPWSPDWQPATPEETTEEEWPYDESLTLSDAELEISGLEEDEELESEQPETEEPEAEEPAAVTPEADEPESVDTAADEAEEAAAREVVEAEELAAREAEEAAAREVVEAEELAAREAEEAAAREVVEAEELAAREAEEAAAREVVEAEELAAREAEEAAAREVVEAEELAAREAEEAAAREVVEAEELAAREAEEAAAREVVEAEELAAREAEEAAAREVVEAEELAAREAEEAAAREVVEAEELAAREAEEAAAREVVEAEELAAREAEEAAAREVVEAEELAAREAEEAAAREVVEAEELAAREAEEAAAREVVEAEELAAREAEEAAAREVVEAEELAAREAEEAAAREVVEAEELAAREAAAAEAEITLRAVTDAGGLEAADVVDDEAMRAPVEEIEVEDLQAEPEWLEAVEEMTLDDIAEAGEADAAEDIVAALPDEETAADEMETPTEVIESIAAGVAVDEDITDVVIEDATFEVVDLDDADLRADTAEHMFDVFDIEEGTSEDEPIAHDEITAEVEITDDLAAESDLDIEAELIEAEDPPLPSFHYEVPTEFEVVAADVDGTRDALAAFMMPRTADAVVEPVELAPDEPEADHQLDEAGEMAAFEGMAETSEGQLQITTGTDEPLHMLAEAPLAPVEAAEEPEPEPELVEDVPLRPEDELIAQLTGDLTMPDFETFVQEDFARDFVAEPTQEHVGLAETISTADAPEQSAVAATMPGVDHGHVGFEEFDEDLHFDDPDAVDVDEVVAEPGADGTDPYSSDLTLRAASGVILVALLAATLWAGGVVFLLFIGIIALAAQIEFYAAVRKSGFRPMVLFGLLGGLGALIGTYVQGTDAVRQAPVAIPAALGLTVIATYAWYGSQESPPSDPWRNGLVTVLGVAWIPALLALVLPLAELERSDRLQIIIVLLIAVAAFDVGSYFVGRALGSRKLSPILSPNKTVEGLIGGIIATVIVALLAAALVEVFDLGTALAVAAGVIIAAPLGDLAESLMKRSLGIKDMGQLIPGHGGVLDRIDSYLFAVPIAYLVLRWTGLF